MRKCLVIVWVAVVLMLWGSPAWAGCTFSVPNNEDLSYENCPDFVIGSTGAPKASPVSGFAWAIGDPIHINSGAEDIVCEDQSGVCLGGGTTTDGVTNIQFDWGDGPVNGCPVGASGGVRVAESVQCA